MASVVVLALVGALGGCAGRGRRATDGESNAVRGPEIHAGTSGTTGERGARVERESWPLPVWPGTTLVMPWGGGAAHIEEGVRVSGGGDAALPATLWRVWVERAGATWSGPVAAWDAERVDAQDEASLARAREAAARGSVAGQVSWLVLAVEVPTGFYGEEIVVDGTRVRIAPSPELVDSSWISPMPAYADWGALLGAAVADEASPVLRWRARLLRAGVPDDPTRPVGAFENPLLEAMAVQEELRWRAGLSRLHDADAELARRVRARILPVVQSAQAELVVPLWTQDAGALSPLKDALLDDRATSAMLVERAESWLRRQPEAAAWFEHAFAQDAPGAPAGFVRAWVGNVSERELLAWMEFRAERPVGAPVPEPVLLPPGELRLLEAPVIIGEGLAERVSVAVHVGARVERGEIIVGAAAVEPPGLMLGPLVAVHDAGSLLGGGVVTVEGGACAATLRRIDGAGPDAAAGWGRWSLLIECSGPGEVGAVIVDLAHDGGRTRLEVRGDGSVAVDAPAGLPVSGYPLLVPVAREQGVWMAEVPVPDWCVGLDGKVRLSLMRRGAGDGMWSWPTRVLRLAPDRGGRAVIELEAWDQSGVR